MASDPSGSRLFRDEAIKHHFRDPDSRDVLKASPLWTWPLLLVSAILAIAAAVFVTVTEVEVLERAEGAVQTGNAHGAMPAAAGEPHVVAYLADKYSPFVHPGDSVRLELRDYPRGEFGFIEGRVTRIAPKQVPREECPGSGEARPALVRVEVAVTPPTSGPLANVRLRAGMTVSVQVTLRKQRLIRYIFEPMQRWFR
jgi:multidrug efflux pump subunit AcrA (membrane-fusion protein)